jgi:hypothetical protein
MNIICKIYTSGVLQQTFGWYSNGFWIDGVLQTSNKYLAYELYGNAIGGGVYPTASTLYVKPAMLGTRYRRRVLTSGISDYGSGSLPVGVYANQIYTDSNNMTSTSVNDNEIVNGTLSVTSTVASSSTSTGALLVSGGIGVANDIYCSNIFPSYVSLSLTTSGAIGTQTLTAKLYRLGNLITIAFDELLIPTIVSVGKILTSAIPIQYRPLSAIRWAPITVYDNGFQQFGTVYLDTAGVFQFCEGTVSDFTGSPMGILATTFTYSL